MIFSWAQVALFFIALSGAGWLLYPSEYFRGQMHRLEGDRSQSIEFFSYYLERHPHHKGATMALAAAYEAAGRPEQGLPVLLSFYRHRRGDFESGQAVLRLYERCALKPQAAEFRWELIGDLQKMPHPDRRQIEAMLYEAYQRASAAQDDEGTLRALGALAALGGKDSGYRDQVLRLYLARGRFDKALAMLRENLLKEPKNAELRRAVIRLYRLSKLEAEALAEAAAALEALPGNAALLGDRASLLIDSKRWAEAEADLKLLMARQPKEPAWPREFARCLIEQGRVEDGARILDRLVREDPADRERWMSLVYAYSDRG
ncbi:MAG: hypothetical protein HYV15_04455, partial [Elusimicrobia bacterium]|nr:hypothetical protein [Elusimicrobiota bacterium]